MSLILPDNHGLIGQGFYTIPEAAKIARAQTQSVRRWVAGYHIPQQDRQSPPVLPSGLTTIDGISFITFQHLVEILFVHLFRQHKISMPVIRAASEYLAKVFDTDHPFALDSLKTDGRDIFVDIPLDSIEGIPHATALLQLRRGQVVIREFAQEYFLKLDYENLEAARYWPLGHDRAIVLDPKRSFGSPIEFRTGVAAATLFNMYRSGESIDKVAYWYNVERASVLDAIEFETKFHQAA